MCCVKEDNSYKKFHNDDYWCKSCAPCEPMHPLPMPVILACGHGHSIDIDPDDRDKWHDAGSVQVDTTCLCKPCVKVDFCANIFYEDVVGYPYYNKAKLSFILKRCCNGCENTLKTFVYRREFDLYCCRGGGMAEAEEVESLSNCEESQSQESESQESQSRGGGKKGKLVTQDSFCFTFCDCPCSGCCTYKVIVKDDVDGYVQEISIKDTQINAIAQGQCNC